MSLIKSITILFFTMGLTVTGYAAQYSCPSPSEIKVLPILPGGFTPLPGLALWFAPAMPTSIGGAIGFGVSDGRDMSVGPFVGSGSRTIIVNGHPIPGYYCTYVTKTTARSSDIEKQIEQLPPQYRALGQELVAQGPTISVGTLDYILKKAMMSPSA